jgi:hypothetical protein
MTQVTIEEAQRRLPELLSRSFAMIELTEHQQKAVDTQEQPPSWSIPRPARSTC